MKREVLAICMVLLFISAIVWAVPANNGPQARAQWWPGEGPGAKETISGKVLAISATSITVQTRTGQAVIVVTPETRVMYHGEKSTLDKIVIGDRVNVRFGTNPDGSRFARAIGDPKPSVEGKITAISGNTLTLTGNGQTLNVTITPDTKIESRRYVGTPADLVVGYSASVQGDVDGDTIVAKAIEFRPVVIKGVVQSISGNVITVTTINRKTGAVTVSDKTVVLICPRTDKNVPGTLADVQPGLAVNIGGHLTGPAAMNALWIDVLTTGNTTNPGAAGAGIRGASKLHR